MFGTVTPEKAIAFVRYSTMLTFSWPLPRTATKFQVLRFKIFRLLTILSGFLLLLQLLYTIYLRRDSALEATRSACFVLAALQIIIQTSYCMSQYDCLQNTQNWYYTVDLLQQLISEMTTYLETAKPYERSVFQSYTEKYSLFYVISIMWLYGSGLMLNIGPFFISQLFPINTEYPFPVDGEPVRSIIYLVQSLSIFQCASQVIVNVLSALLVLFAAARFEILSIDLRHAKDINTLIQCLKKYSDTKSYAQKVVNVVQYIALMAILLSCSSFIVFAFFLIGRQPLTVKVQFMCLTGCTLLEAFMCALPADQLMDMSQNFMDGVYESTWYEGSLELQKLVLNMMIPQKPLIISFTGIVPVLSLNYYCSYVSNAFSIFATMRIIIGDDDQS